MIKKRVKEKNDLLAIWGNIGVDAPTFKHMFINVRTANTQCKMKVKFSVCFV
jgi:hypothetical protein